MLCVYPALSGLTLIGLGLYAITTFNLVTTIAGKKNAPENPWGATTLEWTTPSPPPHGNWPGDVPAVYRGPYEYGNPGAEGDCVAQTVPADAVPARS